MFFKWGSFQKVLNSLALILVLISNLQHSTVQPETLFHQPPRQVLCLHNTKPSQGSVRWFLHNNTSCIILYILCLHNGHKGFFFGFFYHAITDSKNKQCNAQSSWRCNKIIFYYKKVEDNIFYYTRLNYVNMNCYCSARVHLFCSKFFQCCPH